MRYVGGSGSGSGSARRISLLSSPLSSSSSSSSSRTTNPLQTHHTRTLSTLRRPTTTPTTLSTRILQHPPRRTLFIQTEPTPNTDALKFLPGTTILPPSTPSLEYLSGRTSHTSPLARKLFSLDGVSSVFFAPDYITVTKTPDTNWAHLKPEVFSLITETLNSAPYVVDEALLAAERASGASGLFHGSQDTAPSEDDSEVVSMIKELLDTRIRPAIQEDGGDIEFRGFEEDSGKVFLKLRGACRTCDSSTVTLKNGIESMLMHYVEEVKEVEQVLDQEEEVAIREFERFEERLRKGKEGEEKRKEEGEK
ncbi:scaffold protein Nfu/NifU N terminal-domain-containing protein [Peziza echinospora]|nr:scaffold protein Nfu/NifU N terminal-domain-containing protein [Peziza echinospora]